jgi:UDP-N-acetylmuramyl tripeptide synthase
VRPQRRPHLSSAISCALTLLLGILRETDHGLIVTEANQFKFGNNHELQKTNILLVRKFLRDLMDAGIELPGGV